MGEPDPTPVVRAARVEGLENLSEEAVLRILGITVGETYDLRTGAQQEKV